MLAVLRATSPRSCTILSVLRAISSRSCTMLIASQAQNVRMPARTAVAATPSKISWTRTRATPGAAIVEAASAIAAHHTTGAAKLSNSPLRPVVGRFTAHAGGRGEGRSCSVVVGLLARGGFATAALYQHSERDLHIVEPCIHRVKAGLNAPNARGVVRRRAAKLHDVFPRLPHAATEPSPEGDGGRKGSGGDDSQQSNDEPRPMRQELGARRRCGYRAASARVGERGPQRASKSRSVSFGRISIIVPS